MISLVLCHGRKYRVLSSINYNTSTFVDIDSKVEPDLVSYFRDTNINIPGKDYFHEVVIVCGNLILRDWNDINKLNTPLVDNIYRCLKLGGLFYIGNGRYPEEDNIYLPIQDRIRFEYLGKCSRLDIQHGQMKFFKKNIIYSHICIFDVIILKLLH